ncbi:evasin P546-like isoform X1 [Amblyomma americanum]
MKALLYIGASCFLLLALNGSAENTQTGEEYHDYGTDACPFPVLGNKNLKTKSVGCRQECNGGIQTIDDGSPCYVIDRDVWERMVPLLWHNCPLGECEKGVCVDQHKKETCMKGKGEKK